MTAGRFSRRRALALAAVSLWAVACGGGDADRGEADPARRGASGDFAAAPDLRPGATEGWPRGADSIPGTPWTRADWDIFRATLLRAEDAGLDTLPAGEALAAMGALLLGTPYVPRTLEVPGPERLVVNFRGLDCVTFLENALALTRFHRRHGADLLDQPEAARRAYELELASLRYRNGRSEGYASRLHYFSDWLRTHAAAGRITLVTDGLGGVPDVERVEFMSRHPDAYDQLSDPAVLDAVRRVEAALAAAGPPTVLPQDRIPDAEAGIRTGDIIAATSTVPGLDVAHTGLAVWQDGALYLMHAPLVGDSVVVSTRPLASRITDISSQDGIMVARPAPEWLGADVDAGGTVEGR